MCRSSILGQRIEEEPLDQRVELGILLEDVKRVVVPAVFTDQAAEMCGWLGWRTVRFSDALKRFALARRPSECVAVARESGSTALNPVLDEIVSRLPNFGDIVTSRPEVVEFTAGLDQFVLRAVAVLPGESCARCHAIRG